MGTVVISMVISPAIWVITIFALLITPLMTTHEPPSGKALHANLMRSHNLS